MGIIEPIVNIKQDNVGQALPDLPMSALPGQALPEIQQVSYQENPMMSDQQAHFEGQLYNYGQAVLDNGLQQQN